MRHLILAASVLALAGAANAQPPQPTPTAQAVEAPRVSITIYNSNLALVEETRQLDITGGRQRLEFRDVSAAIRAETVSLAAPGVSVIEQNFDFDLLSPAKMMEKAVGQQVQIVRINPGNGAEVRETATVLSVNDGVVLRIGDRIEILRDDGVPTRVIFDKVPDNLRARPTLSVTVNGDRPGRREAKLSYLTTGLGWKADYVALFDEKAGKLDLQGWITLTNQSGTTFTDAETQLVAGSVNYTGNQPNYNNQYYRPPQPPGAVRSAGTEGSATGADYLLYPLPQRTTIAQNQTKQVGFLSAAGVQASKVYQYRSYAYASSDNPANAAVVVQFANKQAAGLGAAMPMGIMRVYIRDQAGDPKFAGENQVPHTPQGSQLDVKIGDAFDVTLQPTNVSRESRGNGRYRYAMSYSVKNARAEPVIVQLVQSNLWRESKVIKESQPSKRLDAGTVAWDIKVPANGETILTFTIDDTW